MRKFLLFLFVSISFLCRGQTVSRVWVADNGDGTYKNPVINADYSDPDAIRVGDDYYMISSSFNHVPGLPILHSKDLVNWKLIGHALEKLPPYDHFDSVRHGGGVWAPSLRYHNKEFYIYYPDPDFGIYLIKSKNISGPWTEPLLVQAGKGLIDPCPLWDDDGKVYLVHAYANSRAGIKSVIDVKELSKDGTKVIGEAKRVYDGREKDPTIEGPKFYKRNGYYYIFAPAGGVSTGWQTVLRSKNVYGPYERKVVMDQGSTSVNGPHQGAWVSTSSNEDWFLHFQDKEAYGRVVHLQPLKWVDDWPVIGYDPDGDGKGEPVLLYKKPAAGKKTVIMTPSDGDEFNAKTLGPQWQWQANPKGNWAFQTTFGVLRMYSVYHPDEEKNIWNLPAILGQKLPAEEFMATVKVSSQMKFFKERFGLVLLGTDYTSLYVVRNSNPGRLSIVCRSNNKADKGGKETEVTEFALSGTTVYLRLIMRKGGLYQFSYSEDGKNFITIPGNFTAKPGRWVGAKLGITCLRDQVTTDPGYVEVDWFRVEPGN